MEAVRLKVDPMGRIETTYPSGLQNSISEHEFRRFISSVNRHRFGYAMTIIVTTVVLVTMSAFLLGLYFYSSTPQTYYLAIFGVIAGTGISVMLVHILLLLKFRPSVSKLKRHLIRVCHYAQSVFPSTVWFLEEHIDEFGVQQGMTICIQTPELHLETIQRLSFSPDGTSAYISPFSAFKDVPPSYDSVPKAPYSP